jgi:hypothetical protein
MKHKSHGQTERSCPWLFYFLQAMAAIFAMAFFNSMRLELFHGNAAEKGRVELTPRKSKGLHIYDLLRRDIL